MQERVPVLVYVLCVTCAAVLGLPAGCTHLQEDGGGGQPLPRAGRHAQVCAHAVGRPAAVTAHLGAHVTQKQQRMQAAYQSQPQHSK